MSGLVTLLIDNKEVNANKLFNVVDSNTHLDYLGQNRGSKFAMGNQHRF